jgi:hypothetical protein
MNKLVSTEALLSLLLQDKYFINFIKVTPEMNKKLEISVIRRQLTTGQNIYGPEIKLGEVKQM